MISRNIAGVKSRKKNELFPLIVHSFATAVYYSCTCWSLYDFCVYYIDCWSNLTPRSFRVSKMCLNHRY